MANKRDPALLVAEVLWGMATAGGAVVATTHGASPAIVALARELLNSLGKYVIGSAAGQTDPKEIIKRIRDEGNGRSVETIRTALVKAMGLRPEFANVLEELADAVQAREDGRDEARFHAALVKLFGSFTEIAQTVTDIKEDTSVIRDETSAMRADIQDLKAAAGIVQSSAAHQRLSRLQVASLSQQLRAELDEKGRRLWEDVNAALAEHSWTRAFELAASLEQWLEERADQLSPDTKIQGLLVLADVAVVRDAGFPFCDRNELTNALRLLKKAHNAASAAVSEETARRMLRVRAKLAYLQGDRDGARDLLHDLNDPSALSLRMSILCEEGKWTDASDLAARQPDIHPKWADAAVTSYLKAGHPSRATSILDWAKNEQAATHKLCVIAFARARYSAIAGEGRGRFSRVLSTEHIDQLRELEHLLTEAFGTAFGGAKGSGLDTEALELCLLLGHSLHDPAVCQRAADLLVARSPVSPELAGAVLRGDIPPVPELAAKLLDEHKGILKVQLLGSMLLVESAREPERAMSLLLTHLTDKANEKDLRAQEEIATAILIVSQYCQPASVQSAHEHVAAVLGAGHRLTIMLNAVRLAKNKAVADAQLLIEPLRDDADDLWLQLAASLAQQQSQWDVAALLLHSLSLLTGDLAAYRNEAEAWERAGRMDNMLEALERAHALAPHDLNLTRSLASTYHRLQRIPDAVKQYSAVWIAQEHSVALTLNFANALILDGKSDKAAEVLREYLAAAGRTPDLGPLLLCAHLLHASGDATAASNLLLPFWDRFCNDHHYLLAALQLGYAGNNESAAFKALKALTEMLDRGTLPEGVLWRASLDDVKKTFDTTQSRRTFINEQYLNGRLPWISASSVLQPSNHSYSAWMLRTQPLASVDHPDHIAEHTIYSTNGFHALQTDEGRELQRIVAPSHDSDIVADMSALITLHRLGLLEVALQRFGKVYLPYRYRAAWVNEQSHIPHHQLSQLHSRQAIVQAISSGQIRVSGSDDSTSPRLDEYCDPAVTGQVILRISQVVQWLLEKGRLSSTQQSAVRTRSSPGTVVTDKAATAALSKGVLITDPLTLQTLHEIGLLSVVLGNIHIMMMPDDIARLHNELLLQERLEESGRWHRDLVSKVSALTNVEFRPISHTPPNADHDDDDERHQMRLFGIDAAVLATMLNLPLLSDDRYCQQGLLNHHKSRLDAAFGSDALLASLQADGAITAAKHAEMFLTLVRWRYRFLLPTTSILRELAMQYKAGLPGVALREVAAYVQDCMRDPGLYGGPEPVDPPMPMSLRWFTTWVTLVAHFIVSIWWDDRFTEKHAAELTRWAARYLLPAWPNNAAPGGWKHRANARRQSLIGHVVLALLSKNDSHKSYRVVNRIRRSLNVTSDELDTVAVDTSNALLEPRSEPEPEQDRTIFVHALNIFYNRRPAIPWRLLPAAQQVGLIGQGNLPADIPPEELDVLRNRQDPKRLPPVSGPFAYIELRALHAAAIYLPDALHLPYLASRKVILDNIAPHDACPLTRLTRDAIISAYEDICASDAARWVSAVSKVIVSIEQDFLLNLAGFAQAQQRHHDEGMSKCWAQLSGPSAESLLAIDQDSWRMLPGSDGLTESISSACATAKTTEELLRIYDTVAGHLTLAPPLDLGTQLGLFLVRSGNTATVWGPLEEWLMDVRRPWRQYHACQALLTNFAVIPQAKRGEFWNRAVKLLALARADSFDSDEAQVWRLEKDLAGHYLRTIELGGYALDAERPLTAAWWAAKSATELLAHVVPIDKLGRQVREWRDGNIESSTRIVRDSWAWLIPTMRSSARLATLFMTTPRNVALLMSLSAGIPNMLIDSLSSEHRAELQNTFCIAVLTADLAPQNVPAPLWMWDCSLLGAAKAFFSTIPPEQQSAAVQQMLTLVDAMRRPGALAEALARLPEVSAIDAVLTCNVARTYCYERPDAPEILLPLLQDSKWRSACGDNMPLVAWDVLAHGLLFLQSKMGASWTAELPYVFLRLSESSVSDTERASFFLTCMTTASLAGNTVGALKALAVSDMLPKLREPLTNVFSSLEALRNAAPPEVGLRMQSVLTILEGMV